MPKEKLYKEIVGGMDVSYTHKQALDDFFDSNVCIPKGVNRHPYADVLHAYAEGVPTQWNPYGMGWVDIDKDALLVPHRIKPSEPVWEYQYACVDEDGKGYITGFYAPSIEGTPSDGILLEETKRVRKEIK